MNDIAIVTTHLKVWKSSQLVCPCFHEIQDFSVPFPPHTTRESLITERECLYLPWKIFLPHAHFQKKVRQGTCLGESSPGSGNCGGSAQSNFSGNTSTFFLRSISFPPVTMRPTCIIQVNDFSFLKKYLKSMEKQILWLFSILTLAHSQLLAGGALSLSMSLSRFKVVEKKEEEDNIGLVWPSLHNIGRV